MEYYTPYDQNIEDNLEEINLQMELSKTMRSIKRKANNLADQTGVEKIRTAFELKYEEQLTMIEVIMKYIKRTTNFDVEYNNPLTFLQRELGFKILFLQSCGADDPRFYEHRTLEEVCEDLIMRSLVNFGYEVSLETDKNDFPSILSFEGQVNKFIEKEGILMYPFFTSRRYNNEKMMQKIHSLLNSENQDELYFHGTSWENSIFMTEEIRRGFRFTDFGRNCFYVSDYLPTAITWAFIRNTQPAVIVFRMDNNWTDNIQENRKKFFSHINENSFNEWKQFVFNSRMRTDNNYHYINGPILANSANMNNANEALALRTDGFTPYQTGVRTRELCEQFRVNILCVIYFRNGTTLRENGL